jgi:hypothetical protein
MALTYQQILILSKLSTRSKRALSRNRTHRKPYFPRRVLIQKIMQEFGLAEATAIEELLAISAELREN